MTKQIKRKVLPIAKPSTKRFKHSVLPRAIPSTKRVKRKVTTGDSPVAPSGNGGEMAMSKN